MNKWVNKLCEIRNAHTHFISRRLHNRSKKKREMTMGEWIMQKERLTKKKKRTAARLHKKKVFVREARACYAAETRCAARSYAPCRPPIGCVLSWASVVCCVFDNISDCLELGLAIPVYNNNNGWKIVVFFGFHKISDRSENMLKMEKKPIVTILRATTNFCANQVIISIRIFNNTTTQNGWEKIREDSTSLK